MNRLKIARHSDLQQLPLQLVHARVPVAAKLRGQYCNMLNKTRNSCHQRNEITVMLCAGEEHEARQPRPNQQRNESDSTSGQASVLPSRNHVLR